MKFISKILTLFLVLGLNNGLFAQAPNSFNYQTAIRNASGAALANQAVNLRLTIRQTVPTGSVVYQETHNKTTSAQGLVSVLVGNGNLVSGAYPTAAQWASGIMYLQVEADVTGGSNFTDMGTMQIVSVPYANFASTSGTATTATTATNFTGNINPGQLNAAGAATGQVLKWNGTNWMPQNDVSSGGGGDDWGSQTAATDNSLAGNGTTGSPLKIAQNGANTGQVLKWTGSAWAPAADATGSSGGNDNWGTQVASVTAPIAGDGTSANPLKLVNGTKTGDALIWNGSAWTGGTPVASVTAPIAGDGTSANPLKLVNGATVGDALVWNGTYWASNNTGWTVNGTQIYRSTGNVGIGTNNPTAALHLVGQSEVGKIDYLSSGRLGFYKRGVNIGHTGNYTDSTELDFGTSNSGTKVNLVTNALPRLTVDGSNVGIGTRSPLTRLHVTGTPSGTVSYSGSQFAWLPTVIAFSDTTSSNTNPIVGLLSIGKGGAYINAGIAGIAGSHAANNIGAIFEAKQISATTRRNYGTYTLVNGSGTLSVGNYIGLVAGTGTTTGHYGVLGTLTGSSSTFSIGGFFDVDVTSSTATNYGVYGSATLGGTNYAGYFDGNVHVGGTLSKAGGSFKIDHPQDPENKYLVHSFVESPDMMNIYNGNITTDAQGYATVTMPSYFEALNMDYRYQLTVISGGFAQAIVSKKMEGNTFIIQTNMPNIEVSWQVTGVRNDAWAQQNRIEAEVEKAPSHKGKYLHPAVYGKPASQGINFIDASQAKIK